MSELLNGQRIVLGTCYYPEHWPENLWKEDLRRMLDTGIEVIRIAEFAWSKVELTEGNFNFDFFDRFLDLAEEAGMKVIFCTPTATPPAWLTQKYPEVLNADIKGNLYHHGMRRHYNYNSPVYRELCARITEKFASHYGQRKCIIGWQIDNELNCEKDLFYSESDTKAFRVFLQEKYGSLEELNKAWGTVFWNQTYTDWEEVYVPRYTYSDSVNPHQTLDYLRFISASARSFAKIQSDIIRIYAKPGDFITTNGLFGHLDNHKLAEESLDFMTYDSYPDFGYCLDMYDGSPAALRDRKWGKNLSEVRAVSPVFGIMEQQSGACGWNTRMEAPNPRPGQITLWTMQSVAHGADYVSYFRWRTCTVGTEIYWHGILDYSGRDNRRLEEIRQVNQKIKAVSQAAGAVYEAEVGVIKDYDNIWDVDVDCWHRRVDRLSQESLFTAAQRSHTPLDYVYLTDSLKAEALQKYKVLFYPHPTIMDESRARLLSEYVKEGGILVIGCRSGYKDMTGQCVMDKLPGVLADLTGTDIPEYSLIAPDAGKVMVDWEGTAFEAAVFTDLLEAAGEHARPAAFYTSDYYAGTCALVCNSHGKGQAWYYGSAFTEEAAEVFLDKLGVKTPYKDLLEVPKECEIAVRSKDGERYLFVLNYSKEPVRILFHKESLDLYTKETVSGEKILEGYGTMVVKLKI